MTRGSSVAVLSLLVLSCGGGSATTGQTSPSPATTRTAHYAVIVQAPLSGTGSYSLFLVGSDGRVLSRAAAATTSHNYGQFGPVLSASNDRVYFLDGDSTVKSLQPDGTVKQAAQLPSSPSVEAHFAVSPDNSKIAVALLSYSPGPNLALNYTGMKLYVSDLDGKGRVDLFSSATVAEWPVGWHGKELVVAVGVPFVVNNGGGRDPHPYAAFGGFSVVDSTTGKRLADVCPATQGWAQGLATQGGVMCEHLADAGAYLGDWAGKETRLGKIGPNPVYWAIEPGTQNFVMDNANLSPNSIYVVSATGQLRNLPGYAQMGFIDTGHLLVVTGQRKPEVYELARSAETPVDLPPMTSTPSGAYAGFGYIAARVPGAL
jgi:hypothetical protein